MTTIVCVYFVDEFPEILSSTAGTLMMSLFLLLPWHFPWQWQNVQYHLILLSPSLEGEFLLCLLISRYDKLLVIRKSQQLRNDKHWRLWWVGEFLRSISVWSDSDEDRQTHGGGGRNESRSVTNWLPTPRKKEVLSNLQSRKQEREIRYLDGICLNIKKTCHNRKRRHARVQQGHKMYNSPSLSFLVWQASKSYISSGNTYILDKELSQWSMLNHFGLASNL